VFVADASILRYQSSGIFMYTVIVANAPGFDAVPFRALLRRADLLIAADGGGNALHAIDLAPQLIVGDLDSLNDVACAAFVAAGAELRRFPPDKDETDLELALLAAVEHGATQIDVLGAIGGRWDQGLANVALLALPELRERRVRLLDRDQEAFLVHRAATIAGQVGDTVSLLPIGGAASGITTKGLQYPLADATLHFERSRGVSNILTVNPASVRLRSGLLLVVRQFQPGDAPE
jgi:thiamine pyrophosphokinase